MDIFDAYVLGASDNDVIKKASKYDVVGFSPYIDSLESSVNISNTIKEDVVIVWGGHLATFSAEELLEDQRNFVDFIVRGEGEITFFELLRSMVESVSVDEIQGLAFRERSGLVRINSSRPLISDLDTLPFPSRDYTGIVAKDGAMVHISASRGCPGNCSFCSINSLYRMSDGSSWRGRSPKNITAEIKELYDSGFRHFKLVDDSFFGTSKKDWKERAFDFCNEISDLGMKDIRMRLSVRANHVEESVFAALKQAGLYAVSVGIESGCQRQLDTFKKGTTVDVNMDALGVLKKLGIITLMGFIGFDPYVNMDELRQNLIFLKDAEFCLTDIVSKPLFVHAGDPITFKLLEEGLIGGRDYPNYKYEIKDDRARRVFRHLKAWNGFNSALYYRVSEPLTAPRIVARDKELVLLDLHKEMRKIDLSIYEVVMSMIHDDFSDTEISEKLRILKDEHCIAWQEIANKFDLLSI
ncbi:B12-binding domain-containing radical SAM protein [Patescibacteria group bacterium]